jgi:hypothetical protein
MKKVLLAGLASLAGVASLYAADVTSVNAVGYANVAIPQGFSMIANPLNTSNNTLNGLLPSAQFGDTVYKWNGNGFDISTYLGSWSPNLSLAPGEGAFIFAAQSSTVTFVGEVLTGNLSNPLPQGFSMRSSQVPQSVGLSTIQFPADFGDTVYKWNPTTSQYEIFTFLGTWSPSDPQPKVGESFWVFKSSSASWNRTFSIN